MRKRRAKELSRELDSFGEDVIGWTTSFFLGAATGVLADGLLRAENGGTIPPDVEAGLQNGAAIEKAIESHRRWEVSEGLRLRFDHDPAAVSRVLRSVRCFFDAQYSYDDMRSTLPRRTFEPGILLEEFDALTQGLLSSALHRSGSVYAFWRAASELGMDLSPGAVASLEMEFFAEGLRDSEETHLANDLSPPLNLFRDADILRLHFALAEFSWGNRCSIAWPIDALAQAGMDGALPELAGVGMHDPVVADAESSAATKICPDCAETIKSAANVCRYCGYRFTEAWRLKDMEGIQQRQPPA